MARQAKPPMERVRERTVWVGVCRIWIGPRDRHGHGKIQVDGKWWSPHRLVWTQMIGPIPEDHDLHHLCENKCCTTLAHLQLLTHAEHTRRHNLERNTCKRGHQFDAVRKGSNGNLVRHCTACAVLRRQARRAA